MNCHIEKLLIEGNLLLIYVTSIDFDCSNVSVKEDQSSMNSAIV